MDPHIDPSITAMQPDHPEPTIETAGTKIFEKQQQSLGGRFSTASTQQWQRLQTFLQARRQKPRKQSSNNTNWKEWSRFKIWRRTRPLVGSILIMLAGILVLWGPIALLPFALLPGSNIWAALLVGGLLFIMGLIQLLAPANALVTGAVAVVLSIISLLVAAGGFGLGMILGIIGGAMGVAWQPASKVRNRSRLPDFVKRPFLRSH